MTDIKDRFQEQIFELGKGIADGRNGREVMEDYDNNLLPGLSCQTTNGARDEVAPPSSLKEKAPSTNRGLVMYQKDEYPENWGGYDGGIECGIYGRWIHGKADVLAALEVAKTSGDAGDEINQYIELGGYVVKVAGMGARVGGCVYKYVFEFCGMKIYVHSNAVGSIAPFRVRYGFESLIGKNLFDVYRSLKNWLYRLGFQVEREIVSRLDMQILCPVDIEKIMEAMRGNRTVTLCRGKLETHVDLTSGRLETMTLKSNTVELCIYDKMAQLATVDPIYYQTFRKNVIDPQEPTEFLTRVEFRFRRDWLKRYGITSFDDLERSQNALIEIASFDWFRILEKAKVRGSEREQNLHPIWQDIVKRFLYYFASPEEMKKREKAELKEYKQPKSAPNAARLIKQAVGCIASAAAVTLRQLTEAGEMFNYCADVIASNMVSLYAKTSERQIENEVTRGYIVTGEKQYTTKESIINRLVYILQSREEEYKQTLAEVI